jgi:serine/threonine protein phosphatase PrpC
MAKQELDDAPWEMAQHTDPGLIREHNEDRIAIDPSAGLVILADGMGGYNAGEVASEIAVTEIGAVLTAHLQAHGADDAEALEDVLRQAVRHAHRSILETAARRPECAGMGTTLVMGVFAADTATLAHVGDSRAYLWAEGELRQLTRDHSLLQEQIDAGILSVEEARVSQSKNLVTRALGVEQVSVEPEVRRYEVRPGDCFMFCSDGLSDMVADDELAAVFAATKVDDPGFLARTAESLVASANHRGGRDNISVALVRARRKRPAGGGLLKRLFSH